MGSLHIEVVKLLLCFTLSVRPMTVVINAESTEFILDKLKTSIDNMKTTAHDVLTLAEELNSLDNIGKKLDLLETLTEHIYTVSNRIISFVEYNQGRNFEEMKKTGLKVMNLVSEIYTVIVNIRLNPGSLPEYSVTIVTRTEEVITLVHHFNTMLFIEDLNMKSKYESTKVETFHSRAAASSTVDSEYQTRNKEKRVRFKEDVTVYEYSEEDIVSGSPTTVRRCSLNDETEGFCSKEESLAKDVSHDFCKSYLKPSLKTHSSYEKEIPDSCLSSKYVEKEQCIFDKCASEEGYSKSSEDGKETIGKTSSSLENNNNGNGKLMSEEFISNEILSNRRQRSNAVERDNQCPQEAGVNPSEETTYTVHETCSEEDIFVFTSDNKPECENTSPHLSNEDSCLSLESTKATEDSLTPETREKHTNYEETITTEKIIIQESDKVSEDNADENGSTHYVDSSAETTTTGPSSSLDKFDDSEKTVTTEDYTTTETYTNTHEEGTSTTESSSAYNDYGYSNEYRTTTTESYGYTTESPSYYCSDSYSEPTTTTEQTETTTERDLSSLSQNIYSVAQDLSTKAQEISTVTSEISTKVSEISSALSDINTDDQDVQNKIQGLSKLTQEISSKTSEISTLSSETSRLASDISTASSDIPNVDNKEHPHRISPRQRITSKSQDLITSTQNIITAAQDVIVKIQDLSFRSYDLSKADMISAASHDVTSRTQGIITEALDIVTAALEIMTSVDF